MLVNEKLDMFLSQQPNRSWAEWENTKITQASGEIKVFQILAFTLIAQDEQCFMQWEQGPKDYSAWKMNS